jgi:hypothetical protein
MSGDPSSLNSAAPVARILMKFDIWVLFENNITVALKSDNSNGYFT